MLRFNELLNFNSMFKRQYRIKLRESKDYEKLIDNVFTSNHLNLKTEIFNNSTIVRKEDDYVVIDSKLNISVVTIGCSILLLYFSFIIVNNFDSLAEIPMFFIIVIVFALSTIESQHSSIEKQIFKKLY